MKRISSIEKFSCSLFSVTEDVAVAADGFEIKRNIINHPGSAVMLAADTKRRILLVRQFRLPAEKFLWELPAGKLDAGETALQAAKRELKEETGCRARTWSKLVSFFPSPGFLAEKMTIYVATDLTEGEATPMDDERIEKQWFSAVQVEEMIATGAIQDAKTIIGYYCWQAAHKRSRAADRKSPAAKGGKSAGTR
jgi:ADP-ribose pyrophosphatase